MQCFPFRKTPEGITNLPITIYALLSNFCISGFTRFFAPTRGFSLSPRPASQIFTLAPPRRKMLGPAHPWYIHCILLYSTEYAYCTYNTVQCNWICEQPPVCNSGYQPTLCHSLRRHHHCHQYCRCRCRYCRTNSYQ